MPHGSFNFLGRFPADVVELGSAHLGAFQHLYFLYCWRIEREDALHPYPVNDVAYGKCRARLPAVLPGEHDAFKGLQAAFLLYLVFLNNPVGDFLPDAYTVPGAKVQVFPLLYVYR